MKRIILPVLISCLLTACSRDKSTSPPQALSCGPNPNLEAVWNSDSIRIIETDSNNVVLFDWSGTSNAPSDYLKLQFFCLNGIPYFFGESYQSSTPTVSHDSSQYHLVGNTIYYAPASVTDTTQMDSKKIEYFQGNILHLRWSAIYSTTKTRHDEYYYMRK